MCPIFGVTEIINFPIRTNGKLIILDVPIFKQITRMCLPFQKSKIIDFYLGLMENLDVPIYEQIIIISLIFGTAKVLTFFLETNGILIILDVPVFKQFP